MRDLPIPDPGTPDTRSLRGSSSGSLAADRLPDQSAVSVVTLAELELGVHMAGADDVRARRLRTLRAVQSTYAALPIDEAVSSAFAELVATGRRSGAQPRIQDAWIAATARVHDVPVVTQDRDFGDLRVDVIAL